LGVVGENNGGSSHANPTHPSSDIVLPPAQNRGQANVQPNKAASTNAPPWCSQCGEAGHKTAGSRKCDSCGKELFIDFAEPVDVNLVDIEQGLTYDVGGECE
jgi:hypothetical protein